VTVTKKRKPEAATCYAIRLPDGDWIQSNDCPAGSPFTLANAGFFATRAAAKFDAKGYPGAVIIPCRIRVLPSAKRNRTRTR